MSQKDLEKYREMFLFPTRMLQDHQYLNAIYNHQLQLNKGAEVLIINKISFLFL